MKVIRLNGSKMVDKAAAHAYLKRRLSLPDYYGKNLDALWDCLSTDFEPKKIFLYQPETMVEHLGSYGRLMIQLLQEVTEENQAIQVVIKNKKEE